MRGGVWEVLVKLQWCNFWMGGCWRKRGLWMALLASPVKPCDHCGYWTGQIWRVVR